MRCEKFVKLFSIVTLEFNHSIIENMDVVAETYPTLKEMAGAMDASADKERIRSMKKIFIKAMSLLLAVGISLSVSSSASAYKLKDYFLEEPKISFVCENWADSKTKSAAVRAVEAWRNAVSPVVTFDSSAAVTVFFNDGNLPEVEWDGYCQTVHYTDGRVIRSFITFNSAKSTWNNTSALQSVAVHELGHAMGLDDLYDGSKAIMNGYTGQRYGIHKLTTPQSDDIKGINALYK